VAYVISHGRMCGCKVRCTSTVPSPISTHSLLYTLCDIYTLHTLYTLCDLRILCVPRTHSLAVAYLGERAWSIKAPTFIVSYVRETSSLPSLLDSPTCRVCTWNLSRVPTSSDMSAACCWRRVIQIPVLVCHRGDQLIDGDCSAGTTLRTRVPVSTRYADEQRGFSGHVSPHHGQTTEQWRELMLDLQNATRSLRQTAKGWERKGLFVLYRNVRTNSQTTTNHAH
jgi:hypothetical protein